MPVPAAVKDQPVPWTCAVRDLVGSAAWSRPVGGEQTAPVLAPALTPTGNP